MPWLDVEKSDWGQAPPTRIGSRDWDPTDPTSRFAATIDFVDGTPIVTWSPNVADGSRIYHIWGKESLGDANRTQIDATTTADYNFFKATVEMK